MKSKTFKKNVVIVTVLILTLIVGLLTGAGSLRDSKQFEEELESLVAVAEGSVDILVKMGMYESPDGTIDSLTETELQEQLCGFNSLVDQFYSRESPMNEHYKWLHEDLLRVGKRNSNDHCFDAGILGTSVLSFRFGNQNDTAYLDAIVTAWNKRVNDEGRYYTIESPINRTHVEMELVKEDGQWKVKEVPVFDPLDSGFDLDSIETVAGENKNILSENNDVLSMGEQTDAKTIQNRIDRNLELLQGEYATYEEALAAAREVDVTYSYYAL